MQNGQKTISELFDGRKIFNKGNDKFMKTNQFTPNLYQQNLPKGAKVRIGDGYITGKNSLLSRWHPTCSSQIHWYLGV